MRATDPAMASDNSREEGLLLAAVGAALGGTHCATSRVRVTGSMASATSGSA
jgi:hypothetical protein